MVPILWFDCVTSTFLIERSLVDSDSWFLDAASRLTTRKLLCVSEGSEFRWSSLCSVMFTPARDRSRCVSADEESAGAAVIVGVALLYSLD